MKTSIAIMGCATIALFSYAQTAQRQFAEFPTPSFTMEKVGTKTQIPIEGIIDLRDLLDDPIPALSILATSKEENTFQVLDDEVISKHKLRNDSLWLVEKETPLTKLVYNQPELKLTFPLQEGKNITGSVSGKGYYADKLSFKFYSTYESSVSSPNAIIMPDGTKLDNVYRVKTTHTTFYSDLTSDSIRSPITEEENFWYLQGEIFPILASYQTMGCAESYKSCYYVREPQNETFENEDTEQQLFAKKNKDGQTAYTPLKYKATNHEDSHEIEISYKTMTNTNVTFTIASVGGVIYLSRSYKTKPGEEYVYHYNYSHLPWGEYAVRIGVNNQHSTSSSM